MRLCHLAAFHRLLVDRQQPRQHLSRRPVGTERRHTRPRVIQEIAVMKNIHGNIVHPTFLTANANRGRKMKNMSLQMVAKPIVAAVILLLFSAIIFEVSAQYRPNVLRSGSSEGSKSLSDFEQMDPYTGNLNFSLPLKTVSGRGAASLSLSLNFNQKWSTKDRFWD